MTDWVVLWAVAGAAFVAGYIACGRRHPSAAPPPPAAPVASVATLPDVAARPYTPPAAPSSSHRWTDTVGIYDLAAAIDGAEAALAQRKQEEWT